MLYSSFSNNLVEDPSRSHVIKRSWVVFEQDHVSSGQNYSQICSWDPAASIEANEFSLDDVPWPLDIDIGEHDLGGAAWLSVSWE